MSCGSPVIVAAPGDCARIVERTGAGLTCPPEDWRALADRLLQASALSLDDRAAMARRARESYQAEMSMRTGVDALEAMLRTAADQKATR
jgi:glycosyltransferase involved in cell wall biosynthesis